MANLTAPYDVQESDGKTHWYPVAAATKIIAGGFVIINGSGYAGKMVGGTASQLFVGVALETADNTGGGNGAIRVKVRRLRGSMITRNGTGFVQTNLGAPAYALDDNTVTATAGTNTQVGTFEEIVSATEVRIAVIPTA